MHRSHLAGESRDLVQEFDKWFSYILHIVGHSSSIPVYVRKTGMPSTVVGFNIIKEYNEAKTVAVTIPKRSRQSYIDQFGDFKRNAVHRHVHQILFRREIPTMNKTHRGVSTDDSLLEYHGPMCTRF